MIAHGIEPHDAYTACGYMAHRANCFRLERQCAERIAELRGERETNARAAAVPIGMVLEILDSRGFEKIADFFTTNSAGVFTVRDLRSVPVEAALAFLRVLGEGFGIGAGAK